MRFFFILFLFLFLSAPLDARTNDHGGMRMIIQDELGERATEEDGSGVRTDLLDLFFKPLDINLAQEADLLSIPGVTPALAERIIRFVGERSNISDLKELTALEGMDTDIYHRIVPFMRGDEGKRRKKIVPIAVNAMFSSRTAPFERLSKHLTSVEKARLRCDFYERLRVSASWNDVKVVMPGKFFADLKNLGPLKHLLVGNYKLTFGQGLVLGSYGPSKGRDVLRNRNNSTSLMAGDLSSYVNKNFMGVAAQVGTGPVIISGFYSEKKLAAVVEDEITAGDRQDDTPEETASDFISDYDSLTIGVPDPRLRKKSYGGRAEFHSSERRAVRCRTGFTMMVSRFNLPVQMIYTSDGPYAFSGKDLLCSGWDWIFSSPELDFFGEAALSSSLVDFEHSGFYTGVAYGRTGFRSTFAFRHYGLLFHDFDNAPFSEYRIGRGETGWYLGTAVKPTDRTVIQFSGDLFRRNWRGWSELIPPIGWEVTADLRHELFFDLFLHVRAATGQKERRLTAVEWPGNYEYTEDLRIRGDIEWKATYRLTWKAALESVRGGYHDLPEMDEVDGNLLYSEFSYLFSRRSEIVLRNEVYDVRNGASISVYEDSSPTSSSYKPLYGTGTRHYLFLSYELPRGKNVVYLKTAWTIPMMDVLSGEMQSSLMEENDLKYPKYEIQFHVTSEF